MKTNKQIEAQRKAIERGEHPNIGYEYECLLSYAQRGSLAFYVENEWTGYPQRTKQLQAMGLIDHKFRLTKLGQTYYSQPRKRPHRPRPDKKASKI